MTKSLIEIYENLMLLELQMQSHWF